MPLASGYELPWKRAQVLPDGKIAYPRTKLSKAFPSEVVQYYYRFKLDWYASTSPNPGVGEARLIDFSFNPLYVLHDVLRNGHELLYEHSLVDLACRNAAGADDETEVIEAIYEQFESRQVKRYESNLAMKYFSNGQVIPYLGLPGAPGQNQPNPRAEFRNHAICSYQGKVYNPSYGTPLTGTQSENEWGNTSLEGFGVRMLVRIPAAYNTSGMDVRTFGFFSLESNSADQQTAFFAN